VSTSRRYQSSLREQRARETRLRIRETARQLFGSQGFTETTIAQIAQDAGVATQTVYAVFGNKGGIVSEILEDLEESADRETWIAQVTAEEDPQRQLRVFVSWIRALFEQGSPILRAALVARSDPDVAALIDQGDTNRRSACSKLTEIWSAKGELRTDLEPAEAAQRMWLLTSVEQYLLAADTLGWTPDHYEDWLGDVLEEQLLRSRRP
jgi:TetR/AcrR family transcriptional regulator of autoinduction and epiphytic fitness